MTNIVFYAWMGEFPQTPVYQTDISRPLGLDVANREELFGKRNDK